MKEIELKTVQELFKTEINTLNVKYIIVFIVVNFLIVLINWYIQRNIKKIDGTLHKLKVREERRIDIIEEIYKELVSFTYILNDEEMMNSISRISILEKKLSENRLYIDSKMNNAITKFIDYLKELTSDFRGKNFEKEKVMLNKIEKEFNK